MAEPQIAASWGRTRGRSRPPDEIALDLVAIATLAALAAGLGTLTSGDLAWDREAAIAGVAGQLGETLPAALLVLVATSANLAAGAVLARLAAGAPFRGPARAIVGAGVAAVLLDTAALLLLGGLALFRGPLLIAIHVAILALPALPAFRPSVWPLVEPGSVRLSVPGLPWAIVGVAWLGIVVLQLASPVVPFLDVLPNHVAPVERLRTFGEFAVLTETASPIYGPSRTFLGYVGLVGTIATMTGLPAGLAIAGFIFPSSLLVAVGVQRLATAIAGTGAALWGLVAFTLTVSFARLTDARATVVVLPVALGALAWVADRRDVTEADPAPAAEGSQDERPVRDALLLGAALGAATLVHPVVGALTAGTVGLVALIRPAFAPVGVAAVAVGAALALPQAVTMLGLAVPAPVALLAFVPALALGRGLASRSVGFAAVILGRGLLAALVPVAVVAADRVVGGAVAGVGELAETMPLLVLGAIAGLALAPRAVGHPVVLAGLASGAAVAALTRILPGDGLLADAIRFELPKTLHYWLPVFAALAAAAGLSALWRRAEVGLAVRAALVGLVLVVLAMPFRAEAIDDHHLGEHHLAETLAIDLRHAGRGYWVSYPDSRRVVDQPRQALVDVVRQAIADGRIDRRTELLHVARSFQQWVATPFGVFTGVRETLVSPDAAETIHTVGGRLRPPDRLDALLAGGTFGWVVLEPGDGVPADARARILAAGYEPLFANEQGEVFTQR